MSLLTASDLISQGLQFAGELTDAAGTDNVSEYRTKALNYLNRIYQAILSGGNEFDVEMAEPFSWALAPQPGIFQVKPAINVTATIAQGATSGSFATAPQNSYSQNVSVAGSYIRFNNFSDVYRVVTHTSGSTTFTIDFAYIQSSQTSTLATCYFLDYALSTGVLRLVSPMRLYQIQSKVYDGEIVGSNMSAMRREFPIAFLQTRYPDRFSIKYQDTSTNTITVQINTNPLDFARVEYDYVPFPTALVDDGASTPAIPAQHRIVLCYAVAYYLCVDKNDNRAQNYLAQTQAGLISIVKAEKKQRVDTNRERGRLIARQDLLKRRSVPWWWGRW